MILFWLFVLVLGMLCVLGFALVTTAGSVVVHAVKDRDHDWRQYAQALGILLIGILLLAPGAYAGYVLCFLPFCRG